MCSNRRAAWASCCTARAARAGVYQVQDILRRLGTGPDAKGLDTAREILKFIPQHHYLFEPNGKLPIDLAQDAGIVDMLLHPQDRAYSVPEVMKFVADAGLIFFGWSDNADYCADRFLSGELLERVLALPPAEQWAIVENLALLNARHDFFVRKSQSAPFLVRFDTEDYLSYVPQVRSGVKLAGDANALVLTRAAPQGTVVTPISRSEALMLEQIDSRRRISDILTHPMFSSSSPQQKKAFARVVCERMWRLGHLLYGRARQSA